MILHLSAPLGKSINDHISKENFSLHCASVDYAIHMLSALGKGALMAKVEWFQSGVGIGNYLA